MLITKKIIDLIIYAHKNGIDMQEFEAVDATDTNVVDDAEPKKKKPKKHSYTTKASEPMAGTGASISDKEVLKMRQFISVQKALGKLTDDQVSAVKELSGTFARNLSLGQREQLRNIYEDLKQ